jgi:hypothetical protein
MKTCSKCKETKPLEAFGKDKHNNDGLRYKCKDCTKLERKQRWANLTAEEKKAGYDRLTKWRNNQNEEKQEKRRASMRVENMTPEQQERRRLQAAESRARRPEKVLFNAAKSRAKRKGIPFAITEEDVIIPDVCPVLGIPLIKGQKIFTDNSPTIDKIDNTKGYIKGNIQVISYRANALKGDGTIQELEMVIEYMRNNLNNLSAEAATNCD